MQETGSRTLRLDALKIPHHGSKHNNPVSLFKKLNCRRYLVSTNGKRFEHPHVEAIARIVKYGGPGAQIYFNYLSPFTKLWDVRAAKDKFRYQLAFRRDSDPTLDIEL